MATLHHAAAALIVSVVVSQKLKKSLRLMEIQLPVPLGHANPKMSFMECPAKSVKKRTQGGLCSPCVIAYLVIAGIFTSSLQRGFDESDDYSLGLHLIHEHKCSNRVNFNKFDKDQTVSNCNPSMLEKQEHLFIHRLGTLHPVGLNKNNPFGLTCLS